jgi:hypothetical protein
VIFFLFLWLVKAGNNFNSTSGGEQDTRADSEEGGEGDNPKTDSIFHACSIAHPQTNASFFFIFFTIVRN